MRLRGEVDHEVGLPDEPVHQVGVRDVALDELDTVAHRVEGPCVPAYVRASSTTTAASGRVSTVRCTKFAPMKPAPPVTSTRTADLLDPSSWRGESIDGEPRPRGPRRHFTRRGTVLS